MLDRIEAARDSERLRRFVADASHELRTPLAAVRAYAELFGRGAAARPEDLERSMTGITRESERMSLLVDDLLLLARLDEGRPLEREPVDLARARRARRSMRRRAVEPDRPIAVDARARRDRSATATACARSSTTSSRTSARTRRRDAGLASSCARRTGRARLTVADRGPG